MPAYNKQTIHTDSDYTPFDLPEEESYVQTAELDVLEAMLNDIPNDEDRMPFDYDADYYDEPVEPFSEDIEPVPEPKVASEPASTPTPSPSEIETEYQYFLTLLAQDAAELKAQQRDERLVREWAAENGLVYSQDRFQALYSEMLVSFDRKDKQRKTEQERLRGLEADRLKVEQNKARAAKGKARFVKEKIGYNKAKGALQGVKKVAAPDDKGRRAKRKEKREAAPIPVVIKNRVLEQVELRSEDVETGLETPIETPEPPVLLTLKEDAPISFLASEPVPTGKAALERVERFVPVVPTSKPLPKPLPKPLARLVQPVKPLPKPVPQSQDGWTTVRRPPRPETRPTPSQASPVPPQTRSNRGPEPVSRPVSGPPPPRKNMICRTILAGDKCRFGARCCYAHSDKDIVANYCRFDGTCRKHNPNGNDCPYWHTGETAVGYMRRMGVKG